MSGTEGLAPAVSWHVQAAEASVLLNSHAQLCLPALWLMAPSRQKEPSAKAQAALHAPSRAVTGVLLSLARGLYACLGCAGAAELVTARRGATGRFSIGLWSGLLGVKPRGLGS